MFHLFIAAAVIDQRHGGAGLQRLQDPRREVGGGDEVDVVGTLGDQLLEDRAEALRDTSLPKPSAEMTWFWQ